MFDLEIMLDRLTRQVRRVFSGTFWMVSYCRKWLTIFIPPPQTLEMSVGRWCIVLSGQSFLLYKKISYLFTVEPTEVPHTKVVELALSFPHFAGCLPSPIFWLQTINFPTATQTSLAASIFDADNKKIISPSITHHHLYKHTKKSFTVWSICGVRLVAIHPLVWSKHLCH